MLEKIIRTDVLIIGGGVAALRGAVEASKAGIMVTILIKDAQTCSRGLVGFNAAIKSLGDSPAKFFNDTLSGGEFLNDPKLVATMVYKSEDEVRQLQSFGVPFDQKNGRLMVRQASGCSYPRTVHYQDKIGPEMMSVFYKILGENGVNIYRHTAAFELIKKNGRVVGALAVDKRRKELVAFMAKATVLACGGVGNIYSFTTNPRGITGDGYMMAYRVGAKLRDMEFVQFEPFIMVYPEEMVGVSIPTTLIWDGAQVYNSHKEEFFPKDDQEKVFPLTKDQLSRMINKEVQEGRGTEHGGVYLDVTRIPDKILNNYPRVLKHCQKFGLNLKQTPIEVAPAHHYMMGGIVIDPTCRTNVPGLYAAGEVAGGVHGANRLAGNSGTDVLVFGAISGAEAAKEAKDVAEPQLGSSELETCLHEVSKLLNGEKAHLEKGRKLLQELRQIMWNNVGIIREASKMEHAEKMLANIKGELEQLQVNDISDLIELMEIKNAVEIAKMVTAGALARKESRGDHYRQELPERDDIQWLRSIII